MFKKKKPYYSIKELKKIGFNSIGNNVFISRKCSIYGASRITIGNNVRIDDFCVLSAGEGGIKIGNYIHIGIYSSLIGNGNIKLCDYSNISSKVSIYSSNDDYSGDSMSNPMISDEFKNVYIGDVYIGEHTIIGCGSVILPNSYIGNSSAVGALSFIKSDTIIKKGSIWAGCPAKYIKDRSLIHLKMIHND